MSTNNTDTTNHPSDGNSNGPNQNDTVVHHSVRPSIKILMIRHAESQNNEIYRDARSLLLHKKEGRLDTSAWDDYIATHRQADPGLSTLGIQQSHRLAEYLVPYLSSSSSSSTNHHNNINIITSPMKRTCDTIRPTILGLLQQQSPSPSPSSDQDNVVNDDCDEERNKQQYRGIIRNIIVNAFYFESEGCHLNEIPEAGMTPSEIQQVLLLPNDHHPHHVNHTDVPMEFVGFHPDPDQGWYHYGTGPETRQESEQRAAKFYCWFCEYLNEQLYPNNNNSNTSNKDSKDDNKSDSPSTTDRNKDTNAPPPQSRQIQLLVGHGDFMSLVLKRIISGFGHAVETIGIPHRSALVHWNTGITELEYFGHGRFLIMSTNTTPHFQPRDHSLLSGGTLQDGWSYLMPSVTNTKTEVSVVFSDEDLDDHVLEQREALKALYLSSKESETLLSSLNQNNTDLTVEQPPNGKANVVGSESLDDDKSHCKHFVVKRGLQVVGVASYSDRTGRVFDVAVRPSGGTEVTQVLFQAVKTHTKQMGRSGSLTIFPRTEESKRLFEAVGFTEVNCQRDNDDVDRNDIAAEYMEFIHDD